jgi:hypothetical protein
MIGILLGLQICKPYDNHVNTNGEFSNPKSLQAFRFCQAAELQTELFANQTRRAAK